MNPAPAIRIRFALRRLAIAACLLSLQSSPLPMLIAAVEGYVIERHRELDPLQQRHVPPRAATRPAVATNDIKPPGFVFTNQVQTLDGEQPLGVFGHSVGGACDVNGDGYDDVIVSAFMNNDVASGGEDAGAVFVYFGSPQGVHATNFWKYQCSIRGAHFGHQVGRAGDVDGDGYDDIVVGSSYYTDSRGIQMGGVFVFRGSAQGLPDEPSWSRVGEQREGRFGFAVGSAGDVNGDGYDDIIVGAPFHGNQGHEGARSSQGRAYIFPGSRYGVRDEAIWMTMGTQEDSVYGYSVQGAGDLNGDGYADVVVGDLSYHSDHSNAGRASVFFGSAEGPREKPDWTLTGNQAHQTLGVSVYGAGDINGDGYDDLLVSANHTDNEQENEGTVLVFHGSPSGLPLQPSRLLEPNQPHFIMGHSVATAGDVNADGFSDVIVGSFYGEQELPDEGVAFVYHGSREGLEQWPDWSVRGGQARSGFSATVRSAGDINGDGFGDVVIGHSYYSGEMENQGRAWIFYGSKKGLPESSGWRPPGEDYGFAISNAAFPFASPQWMLAVTAAVALMIFIMTRMYYRRRARMVRNWNAIRSEALLDERQRLAQDLHDQLGTHLAEMALMSGSTRRRLEKPEMVEETLKNIEATSGRLVDRLNEIVWLARPANDTLENLVSYLMDYAIRALEPLDIRCRVQASEKMPDQAVDYHLRHDLLLAVKEGLHNVVEHARATEVSLAFELSGKELIIRLGDNGRGFDPKTVMHRNQGLENMRQRMERHGGGFSLKTGGEGTRVEMRLSIERQPS